MSIKKETQTKLTVDGADYEILNEIVSIARGAIERAIHENLTIHASCPRQVLGYYEKEIIEMQNWIELKW